MPIAFKRQLFKNYFEKSRGRLKNRGFDYYNQLIARHQELFKNYILKIQNLIWLMQAADCVIIADIKKVNTRGG